MYYLFDNGYFFPSNTAKLVSTTTNRKVGLLWPTFKLYIATAFKLNFINFNFCSHFGASYLSS